MRPPKLRHFALLCSLAVLYYTLPPHRRAEDGGRTVVANPEPGVAAEVPAKTEIPDGTAREARVLDWMQTASVEPVLPSSAPALSLQGFGAEQAFTFSGGETEPSGSEKIPPVTAVTVGLPLMNVSSVLPGGGEVTPAGANGEVTRAEVDALKADMAPVLTALETSLVEEAFSETLPLVGDRFSAAWDNNVAGFRFVGRLRTSAVEGLNALTGAGPFTPVQVQNAINARLTANGFNSGSRVLVTTENNRVQLAFETVDTFTGAAVPIASDFGLPNLDLDLLAAANATTGGSLVCNFTVGLDATGFYLDAAAPHTITFNTTTTVSTTLNARVRFAKLPYRLNDDTSPRSTHSANFALSLRDPDGSGRIRPGEVSGFPDLVDGTVTGSATLSFAITSDLPDVAALPKVRTDLALSWAYNGVSLNEDDANASFGTQPQLSFTAASYNVSSVFKSFARRVLRGIADATSPLDELIAVLTEEIPLLSDLGSEAVTILDVAGAEPEQVAAIEALGQLSALAQWTVNATTADTVWMNMGSYSLAGADLRTEPLAEMVRNMTAGPAAPHADMTSFLGEAGEIGGLEFPLLTNHLLITDLLLGRPVDMFSYRSQEVTIEEDFHVFYPVLGPVGVTLGGRAGVRSRFGFGFDAQGVFDYAAAGEGADPALLFNGFYAMALDENGDPFTGISLYAGITAGVEANVVLASVGVEGDITAEIGMNLDDFIGDDMGRVRGNVISALPFEDLFYAAGSLSAGLRVYVEVGISPFSASFDWNSPRVTLINFDSRDNKVPVLAEVSENDTLVLNVGERSWLRIHGNLDDRAEEFTITAGAGLVVGAFGEENTFSVPARIVAQPNLRGDFIEIAPDVLIPAELRGGDGRDELTSGGGNDDIYGDAGPDKLRGQGGNNNLYGGADNDELTGGPGADLYHGGPGEDTASWADDAIAMSMDLRTGSFGGAAALDTLISMERYRGTPLPDVMDGSDGHDRLINGDSGDDIIRGHGGDDLLEGSAGDDTIDGGDGNDMIAGGSGADTLDGGPGTDTLSYLRAGLISPPPGVRLDPVTVNLATGQGSRGDALGDTFSSFEILLGSGVPAGYDTPFGTGDDLTGSDHAETIHGMGGTDTIRGGGGDDVIYGDSDLAHSPLMPGFDADKIYGDGGNDQLYGQWDNDQMEGGDGNDRLEGGPGDDDMDGGPGTDILRGEDGDDFLHTTDPVSADTLDGGTGYNRLSADYSDKTTPLNFTVGPVSAHTFPDGDAFSNIQTLGTLTTGSANDVIRLSAQQEPYKWNKTINAGPGDDKVIADFRGLYPGPIPSPTSDHLHGGDGVDTISFEQSFSGVNVNLATGVLGRAASGITMSGFENITGSEHVDHLIGDAGPNVFRPLRGYPGLPNQGQTGDWTDGGEGVDTLIIDYSSLPEANQLGVFMGTPVNGGAGIMLGPKGPPGTPGATPGLGHGLHGHTRIESFFITGSAVNDLLITTSGAYPNRFFGLGGDDIINGGAGDDYVDGGDGHDTISGLFGSDTITGGPGNDIITMLVSNQPTTGYGTDIVHAGPGDDTVDDYAGATASFANDTTRFQFDGGPGTDTVSVDLGNLTERVTFSELAPSDLVFSNGTAIRNFERIVNLNTGAGNDVIVLTGRVNNRIELGGGNDILNPGLGIDFLVGGPGDDLLILDYSVGDDSDITGVTWNSGHIRRRISDGALVDQITSGQFDRLHATGSSKADVLVALAGNSYLFGRGGNDTLQGNGGNDLLDGGPGADAMHGSGGDDVMIVDNAGDTVADVFFPAGTDTVRASVNFTLPLYVEVLVLTGSAVNGTGNVSANTITGNAQYNTLRGEDGADTLNGGGGAGEVDRLNGGAAADTFVLGDGIVRFYDDGDPATPGLDGYAVIEDFTPSQSDRLRLTGSGTRYFLAPSPIAQVTGTALYHDSNSSAALETATDELIAILISPVALTPANTLNNAVLPAPVTLDTVGLTDPPVPASANDGSGSKPGITFTISDPLPANARLEVQASTDLGLTDPWFTIASKTGSGAWTGSADIIAGTPSGGRVTVTVIDIRPLPGVSRRFLRVITSAP